MRGLIRLGKRLCRPNKGQTFYQVREGHQTKWMSARDFIQEERNQIIFNQGVLYANRKRTIIATEKI